MALAVDHLALRLPGLLGKTGFLSLDPSHLVDNRLPHSLIANDQRRRDTHTAIGWISGSDVKEQLNTHTVAFLSYLSGSDV